MTQIIRALLLSVSMGPLAQAVAQTQTDFDSNWYTVELLVFENRANDRPTLEKMPLLPKLGYPDNLQSLHSGATRAILDTTTSLQHLEAMLTRPVAIQPITQPIAQPDPPLDLTQGTALIPPDEFAITLPVAFALLAPEEREYNSERRRINRRRAMKVLFHEAWRQPVYRRDTASSLAISSTLATDTGDYPALQGSLLLYVSRYLHMEANLWLNQVNNALPAGWHMPAPPLPPLLSPPPSSPQDQTARREHSELRFELSPNLTDGLLSGGDLRQNLSLEAIDLGLLPPKLILSRAGPVAWDIEAFLNQTYYQPYNHAVLLQQRRRMRSGELHYLDHPRLGLLIKLTPYTFDPFPAVIEPVVETAAD